MVTELFSDRTVGVVFCQLNTVLTKLDYLTSLTAISLKT